MSGSLPFFQVPQQSTGALWQWCLLRSLNCFLCFPICVGNWKNCFSDPVLWGRQFAATRPGFEWTCFFPVALGNFSFGKSSLLWLLESSHNKPQPNSRFVFFSWKFNYLFVPQVRQESYSTQYLCLGTATVSIPHKIHRIHAYLPAFIIKKLLYFEWSPSIPSISNLRIKNTFTA